MKINNSDLYKITFSLAILLLITIGVSFDGLK